jgi:hypothetical protein
MRSLRERRLAAHSLTSPSLASAPPFPEVRALKEKSHAPRKRLQAGTRGRGLACPVFRSGEARPQGLERSEKGGAGGRGRTGMG